MVLKVALRNPFLIIGILLTVIFFADLKKRGILFGNRPKIMANSCTSALVMLNRRVPATWSLKCKDNTLKAEITSKTLNNSRYTNLPKKSLLPILYKEMANNLVFIAKNSLNESLERVSMVTLRLHGPRIRIDAISEGKYVAKLVSINKSSFIAAHLKATVKVKETAE